MELNYEFFKKLLGEEMLSIKEMKEQCNELKDISSIKIAHKLTDFRNIQVVSCGNKPNKYKIYTPLVFTGKYEKIKNLLKFELNNGEFSIYDFNKKCFIGENIPNSRDEIQESNIILKIFVENRDISLQELEWLYSYIDLLDTNLSHYFDFYQYKTCPSGYINWLKNNNYKINSKSMEIYKYSKKYTHVPISLLNEISEISSFRYSSGNKNLDIIDYLYEKNMFDKMLKNSFKKYEINDIWYDLKELCENIKILSKWNINWEEFIDTNRTLRENKINLYNIIENQKNQQLNKNLKKLNFINQQTFNNYIVIVPQNVEDLIKEGKQQNNCVGHYYNDSIAEGKNLIYFLREISSPDKSLVTCRYNLNSQTTAEHRIKNNCSTNKTQNDIIRKIDKIIRENLK